MEKLLRDAFIFENSAQLDSLTHCYMCDRYSQQQQQQQQHLYSPSTHADKVQKNKERNK